MLLTNTTKTSIFLLFLLLNLFTCLGQGSVRLTKKKLFFDRSSPNKELGVWNVTDEEQDYTIFLRKSIMKQNNALDRLILVSPTYHNNKHYYTDLPLEQDDVLEPTVDVPRQIEGILDTEARLLIGYELCKRLSD